MTSLDYFYGPVYPCIIKKKDENTKTLTMGGHFQNIHCDLKQKLFAFVKKKNYFLPERQKLLLVYNTT